MRAIEQRDPRWWKEPDHFQWFSSYLNARGMAGNTRLVLAAVTLSLAWIPPTMLFSAARPQGLYGHVLSLLAAAGAALGALLWVLRFPTRRQSIGFAALSSACITMTVLAQSDPLTAMFACTAFATISGYIALFHSALMMSVSLLIAAAVSTVPASTLLVTDGAVWTICTGGLALVVNVAVPVGIFFIVRALGGDVLRADRDPLTGLYTRRAFYQRVVRLVAASPAGAQLVLAMIDLDRFKLLNDTRGHAEGDMVLASVGRALHQNAPGGAVLGRLGGEEFAVADIANAPNPVAFGQDLCDCVDALPFRITASVGTATVHRERVVNVDAADQVITAVLRAADEAMYVAKRNGGNQVRHHRMPVQLGPDVRRWNEVTKRWECIAAWRRPALRGRHQAVIPAVERSDATTAPLPAPLDQAPNGSSPVRPARVGRHRLA